MTREEDYEGLTKAKLHALAQSGDAEAQMALFHPSTKLEGSSEARRRTARGEAVLV